MSLGPLRNCFITVAERELMLPPSPTKRLVNHALPNDVTEGYGPPPSFASQRSGSRTEALMSLMELSVSATG